MRHSQNLEQLYTTFVDMLQKCYFSLRLLVWRPLLIIDSSVLEVVSSIYIFCLLWKEKPLLEIFVL